MRLRLWPAAWVTPAFAWSCLLMQLRTTREEFSASRETEPVALLDLEFTATESTAIEEVRRVPFGFTPGATTAQITLM
jgi:hypothetical protein